MNILTEIRKFIAFDFKFHASCIPVFVILLLLWPAAVYLPERCGYENELIAIYEREENNIFKAKRVWN